MTSQKSNSAENESVEIFGAREHNLKNIDLSYPRNKLVVITGLSGSGKSSLAFDTIYAEGQRRYMESLSAYARQFIGNMTRPDVDKITGLSPVVSIEQKTTNKNPRSTVGTITEIYDFMRLLFARTGEAYSYMTGEKMIQYTDEQIIHQIIKKLSDKTAIILAPVVKGRKGHYRELFQQIMKQGFLRARIDGVIVELNDKLQVERYKIHDIEIVVDKILVDESSYSRISESLQIAMKYGKGTIIVLEHNENKAINEKTKKIPEPKIHYFSRFLMCPSTGISYDEPAPNTFSFNSPYGACSKCNGLGTVKIIQEETLIPDKKLSIGEGAIIPLKTIKNLWIFSQLKAIGKKYDFDFNTPIEKISQKGMNSILYGNEEKINVAYEFESNREMEYETSFEGITNILSRFYYDESFPLSNWISSFFVEVNCPECKGTRLKKESLYFRIDGKNIGELVEMDILQLTKWFYNIENRLNEKQNKIAIEILKEIRSRLGFLKAVGLDYLTLNRSAKSLSGGESQRIRLATQIGSQLVGVHYILDEPSIGLHQKDNLQLIQALKDLRDSGNTVLVVEHDKEMIKHSDYILDMGPGAGINGGSLIAFGNIKDILKADTVTAEYLNGIKKIEVPIQRKNGNKKFLKLYGAKGNNLKNITVEFPLGKFICVTGVSGSGKSSLINETLYPVLNQHLYKSNKKPLNYDKIEGLENIDKVIEINQSPIGRTPRSNPATYTGVFTDIRNLFTQLPEAKIRGYKAGRFSFNVRGGRCETCQGGGLRVIEMNFLPDVHVHCETCNGKRYNRETLEIYYKGKSINDVLNMTIDEAVPFFEKIHFILRKIKTLQNVGLGYITLGQSSTTISGGEAQRVKLAAELAKKDTGKTFYILDEPTTGLHFEDIKILISVLKKLVDKGNTILVIEHNMDVIKVADHIIDLGPEGGNLGGSVVCSGSPESIAKNRMGYTAQFLKKELYCP